VLDYSVAQPLEARGHGWARPAMAATGLAGVAALAVYLVLRWRDADPRRPDFALYWALATALSLLASLHTQYYDAALLVLAVLLILDYHGRARLEVGSWTRALLVVGYLVFPLLHLLEVSRAVRVQTWVLLPVAVACWAARTLRQGRVGGSTKTEAL
jgi:peptidoglycan/LPS O-acetylase OafA/YrhL